MTWEAGRTSGRVDETGETRERKRGGDFAKRAAAMLLKGSGAMLFWKEWCVRPQYSCLQPA